MYNRNGMKVHQHSFIYLLETFNICVDSNNVKSMEKFKENNNIEFTIDLPERFRVNNWKVC